MTGRHFQLKFAAIVIVAFGQSTPSHAQSALFDVDRLAIECGNNTCQSEVTGIWQNLKTMDLDDAQLNSQLGIMAAILLEVGRDTAPQNLKGVANALSGLAAHSTDSQQQGAFRNVAQALVRGDLSVLNPSEAFAVSPSRPRRRFRGFRFRRGRPRFFGNF